MNTKPITFDVSMMMAESLGEGYGISATQIEQLTEKSKSAQKAVEEKRGTGWLGWMDR